MNKAIYIGIDNGVTGSVGIIVESAGVLRRQIVFVPVPTFTEQNYTKAKANISRIHYAKMCTLLDTHISDATDPVMVLIERPMICPGRFKATVSALRALEAMLIVIEQAHDGMGLPMNYIDSREWQGALLPKGLEGPDELKLASVTMGCRLFPSVAEAIKKQKDADGLLIAEYCRRKFGMRG